MAEQIKGSVGQPESPEAQFKCAVFPKELETVGKRRQETNVDDVDLRKILDNHLNPADESNDGIEPSTASGLIGLAFSGGGIRSATFNLGIIQALARIGILKYVDYLSTVSGGGYIGSCISSLLNDPNYKTTGEDFPFYHEQGKPERETFRHLRNYSNYLAPGGLLDKLRIPAVVMRGVVVNLLVLIPYIVLAVALSQLGFEYFEYDVKGDPGPIHKLLADPILLGAIGLFVLYIFFFPPIIKLLGPYLKWRWRDRYGKSFGAFLLLIIFAVAVVFLPHSFYWYDKLNLGKVWLGVVALAQLIPALFAGKAAENVSKLIGRVALYAVGLLGPLVLYILYLYLYTFLFWNGESEYVALIYLGAVALFVYTRITVNVNATSPHGYYRDRLSKAYLFQVANGNVRDTDTLRLSALNDEGTQGPYHLVNVSHNLNGSADPNLRGRNADFFILSKHFCGSNRVGYYDTTKMEKVDPHLNLGTAMAISGAAAAPNMGTTTIPSLVFIMAFLNIRLGYWLPNPRQLLASDKRRWRHRLKNHPLSPFAGVGPIYLVRELFGRITAESNYVNISDGGHLENMGAYELLRRRCRYIIVGDGEADPDHTFHGLATLIRYAQIDLGIQIEMDLDDLRKREDGFCNKHCAFGTIHYNEKEKGYLLYIKSSMTGDENEYIREYKNNHPAFPHESTADQFFDEAQFEAYRALGYHMVNKLCSGLDIDDRAKLKDWFENQLGAALAPQSE